MFTLFSLWSTLHHSYYVFYDVVDIGEDATAVAVVEDMDGLTLQQFVCEAEVRHIRTTGRVIYREETQARCGDVLQFRIAVANCSLLFFVAA